MSTAETTWARRALEFFRELWDAILEEEAILEESGLETGGMRAGGGVMPDEPDRNQPDFGP